jgi:hypothetical protein
MKWIFIVSVVLPNCNNIAAQESRSIFALKQCLQPGASRFCSSGVKGQESSSATLGEAEGRRPARLLFPELNDQSGNPAKLEYTSLYSAAKQIPSGGGTSLVGQTNRSGPGGIFVTA